MADETYAEALVNISIKGGVIRLDFGSQEVSELSSVPPGATPPPLPLVVRQRVVMPLPAFAQAFGMQEQVMKQLIKEGIFTHAPQSNKANGAESPNFES